MRPHPVGINDRLIMADQILDGPFDGCGQPHGLGIDRIAFRNGYHFNMQQSRDERSLPPATMRRSVEVETRGE